MTNNQLSTIYMSYHEDVLARIEYVCLNVSGGIFKRIDENRELLIFLNKNLKDIDQRYFFIESWLASHDMFLIDLLKSLEWDNPKAEMLDKIRLLTNYPPTHEFPRKWCGKRYTNFKIIELYIESMSCSMNKVLYDEFLYELAGKNIRLTKIISTCFCTSKGLIKRIYENRELIKIAVKEFPEFIEEYKHIEAYIANLDIFLISLRRALQWNMDKFTLEEKNNWLIHNSYLVPNEFFEMANRWNGVYLSHEEMQKLYELALPMTDCIS